MSDKTKVAAAAAGATAEVETTDVPATIPEATPAEAPATTEAPAETDEPASRVTLEDAINGGVKILVMASPELKRVLNQFHGLEKLIKDLRGSVHRMLAVDHTNFGEGEQTFLGTFVKASFFFENMAVEGQQILTGEIQVDKDGNAE